MGKQQKSKIGGNKAKGRRSAKNKASGYYKQRFAVTEKNRKLKRLRHLKRHPNDLQTAALCVV